MLVNPAGCHDGSRRIWSLLDVLKVYAHLYVEIGRSLQYWLTGPHSNQNLIAMPQEDQLKIRQDLEGIMKHSKQLDLKVTQNFVMQAARNIGTKPVTGMAAASMAGEIVRCFSAEIQSRSFFCLLPSVITPKPASHDHFKTGQP